MASLYQVETKRLNEQVRRNRDRFPSDFMFQLTKEEIKSLSRSQNATLKLGHNIKYRPYAFTEQGVAMASGIIKNSVAVAVNIRIMRAFVELRRVISTKIEYESLQTKIKQIESRMDALEANNVVDGTILEKKNSIT